MAANLIAVLRDRRTSAARFGVLLACVLMVLWIVSPIIAVGTWYSSLQGELNPLRLAEFHNAFAAGAWYPRWMSKLYGGYGYPTFLFYQPGFFLSRPAVHLHHR